MEINLNKEEFTETSEFVNFSIREYVAEIRIKDKKKCWPFGSLGDPDEDFVSYQSAESIILSCKKCSGHVIDDSDDTPKYTEASNSSKREMLNGKEDRSETTTEMMIASQGINDNSGKGVCNGSSESASNKVNNNAECQHENSVDEGAKSGSGGDADNYEPGRNRSQKKPQKFHLLSDILRDLAGPSRVHCDRNNVNSPSATQTEDELDDDITLDAIFRKRKGAEDTLALKKKRKTNRVEERRRVEDKRSMDRSKDSHVEVNSSRFSTQTEDDLDDNVTLDVVFRKRKGVEFTTALKKKRRTIRVEEPIPFQDKKSKRGSKDLLGDDSAVVCPRNCLRKTRINDLDTQTMVKDKLQAENVFETQKDFLLPCCQKSNINTEVTSMEATETANNESEMEAVMLLARHFNENKPSTDDQIPVELETVMGCACVPKKLRDQLTESISTLYSKTSSKSATKDPVFYADTSKKLRKENVGNVFCLVQMNDQSKVAEHGRISKPTTASVFQARLENYPTLVCSVNRNPADFSIPNAENKLFMRGG